MTTINLRTSIVIPTLEGDRATLPEHVGTLRALLHHIGSKIKFEIIDSTSGNIHDDFEVSINGKEILFLPGGLDARLKNDDTVVINIVGLGGG